VSFEEKVESFRALDGVELRLTRRHAGKRRAILVVPGIFMHRESPEHRLLAGRLAQIADVVTLDVRGHGDSGGAFSWGRREPEDVSALAARLRSEYERVGGLGFSFGGFHAALAAATHHAFDALALVATPARLFILDHNFATRGLLRSVPWMLRRRRRPTRLGLLAPWRQAPPLRVVERITPTPLLIAHGTEDWLIPVKHGLRLYARAAQPKRLALIEGGLHGENMLAADPEPLLRPLCEFFEQQL
jgi:pimeloyl-ACP methyl ester carboxylesterase